MSTPKLIIVEGETTAKPQQLLEEGEPFDGTGLTVELEIKRWNGSAMVDIGVSPGPVAAWQTQATGIVEVTGVDALSLGSYFVRYKLTNGASEFDYIPNGDRSDLWQVVPVAAR